MQFIDLQAQYKVLKEKIDTRIHRVLDHGQYIMGPEVYEFEGLLADYVGVKHVISCANGTDALQLSLMALGIGPGDAVITTPFTFFATAEAIALVGATPHFSDVDERTFNLCPVKLEEAILNFKPQRGEQLKAVIAVDLFGLPADYPKLEAICKKFNLKLIEDAAQGLGGSIGGKMAGSFGDIATTSFFPAKPLGCYGDGGAVLTNCDELAEIVKSLRVHGKGGDKYDNVRVGMNSRLDTIQAAVLLEKLEVFPVEIEARNEFANLYSMNLGGVCIPSFVPRGYSSSWAQYTVSLSGKRKDVQDSLADQGIPSAIYYGCCLHNQTAFKYIAGGASLKVSESLANSVISLPMSPYLEHKDVNRVIDVLLDVL